MGLFSFLISLIHKHLPSLAQPLATTLLPYNSFTLYKTQINMNKEKLFTLTLHQQEKNWYKTIHLKIITKGSKPSTLRLLFLLLFNYRHIPKNSNFNIIINCSQVSNNPTPTFDKASLN